MRVQEKQPADARPKGPVREMLLVMAGQKSRHKEKVQCLHANASYPRTAGG